MSEEDPSASADLGWVCPNCGEINGQLNGTTRTMCRRCYQARPSEPSWSAMTEPEERPTVRDSGPNCLRTGCIMLGIIALVIAIFAAVWLYEFAKVAPYM